jgi:hypothetical protein
MQATQTRSQGRPSAHRAAIAIAFLVAVVLITLSTLYVATGRTSSSAKTTPAHAQVVGGSAAGAAADQPGLRHNGPLP